MADTWVTVGRFGGAHGLRGHVRVEVFLDTPLLLFDAELLDDNDRPLKLTRTRTLTDGWFLSAVEGVANRTQAETVKGQIRMKRAHLPAGIYGWDLCAMSVVTSNGTPYATVQNVHDAGAGLFLSVVPIGAKNSDSVFIPLNEPFVHVSLETKTITVSDDLIALYTPTWLKKSATDEIS